jgi:hypothetical protein
MDRRHFLRKATQLGIALGVGGYAPGLLADLRCSTFVPPGVQTCEAGIESSVLEAQILDGVQHQPEWCWAACIAMVFDYYDHGVSQERIVKETWGSIVNMPGQPGQILHDLNRPWRDDGGQRFNVRGDVLSTNAVTAAQDLADDHPLIIGTMGHAMVLTDLVYLRDMAGRGQIQRAVVRDPWPGRGRRMLSPQEWYSIQFAARIRVA